MKPKPLILDEASRPALTDRFLSHVAAEGQDECWQWIGAIHPLGYGHFSIKRRQQRAHRVAYALFVGPLVDIELTVDHTCRNRGCVNPGHLELVTFEENLRRRRLDVRGLTCAKGHPYVPRSEVKGRRSCKQCYNDYMREINRAARARRAAAK